MFLLSDGCHSYSLQLVSGYTESDALGNDSNLPASLVLVRAILNLIYQILQRKLHTVRKIGFLRSVRIVVDRACLRLLQIAYGFHRWHADAPLSARPYRHVVADLANSLKPRCVVEVGCGLGSILSLLKAPERYGYDVDAGAVRAAQMIRGRGVTFIQGDMTTVAQSHIDVLILCNWIHEFSPEQLDAWITPLLPRTSYLLLDAIDSGGPEGYRFKHDFNFLGARASRVSVSRAPDEGRSFCVYEVAK